MEASQFTATDDQTPQLQYISLKNFLNSVYSSNAIIKPIYSIWILILIYFPH